MDGQLTRDVLKDPLVAEEVPYTVLTPPGWSRDERLPLVVLLHGAGSSADVLGAFQPVVEGLWAEGALPRSVVASASTPTVGGFYIDHGPGRQWESLVATAFPRFLAASYAIDPERVSLLGASMGGYGALKTAFADPGRWEAVAAVAPALLPPDPRPRNTLGVLAELATAMAGAPGNDVLDRLRANADAVLASGLPIFLRCGDRDVFAMHDGTERLHRALWDLDIGHEYHLVYGADHIGPEAVAAQRAALSFIGAAQRARTGDDKTAADREREAAWRAWAEAGREGPPPAVDAFGPSGPAAMRVLLAPELAEAARRDPTVERRYGILPGR